MRGKAWHSAHATACRLREIPAWPTLRSYRSSLERISYESQLIDFGLHGGNGHPAFVRARTHQHIPYDNSTTEYSGSFDDATLNATVQRFSSDPDAVNYVQHNYDPTGHLKIPVLTLHTLLDPVVPNSHEQAYAQAVAKTGSEHLLVQQSVARYDHCNFKLQEKLTALHQLDQWISDPGQKPQPGKVTIP